MPQSFLRAVVSGGPALLLTLPLVAAEPRDPAKITAEFCVTCHNQNLVGSPAPNLVDALWTHGGNDESILKSIRQGFPASGMQPFEGVLSEAEMQSVIRYIRTLSVEYAAGRIKHPSQPLSVPIQSERQAFRVETFVADLETPWGIAFLPDGQILVTEREGRLRVIRNGKLDPAPVPGVPAAFVKQDGGLLDVIAHPDYAKNGWLYLAYCEEGKAPGTSMTVVVRGRIRDGRWTDQQDIFRAPPERYYQGWIHYGCRFLFDREGHLFFTIGDRGQSEDAQNLASPCGKIHRVFDDGRIPPDNPFVGRAGAWPSIWTLGNRHPQGLMFHPVTGKLWATEHGPTGGDELNRIEGGRNYGWPVASNGTDRRMKFVTEHAGMESPLAHWSPSVAPAGIEFYTGDKFPNWKNHLFIACLGGEQLKRIETDGDKVVHQEIVFKGLGRVRDIVTGPDGLLYLAMNTPGRIARLVPDEGGTVDTTSAGRPASAAAVKR
jgi:glucose/arabinose dehydrogenase